MSSKYSTLSMPSPDSYTEARVVVQQFNNFSGMMDNMFTVELVEGGTKIHLKSFDDTGRMIATTLAYDTANALQLALSDALDSLEGNLDLTADAYQEVPCPCC
jgi:hypothetical protein